MDVGKIKENLQNVYTSLCRNHYVKNMDIFTLFKKMPTGYLMSPDSNNQNKIILYPGFIKWSRQTISSLWSTPVLKIYSIKNNYQSISQRKPF